MPSRKPAAVRRPCATSDAEAALNAFEPVWMRNALRELLRLEEKLEGQSFVDGMPAWADKLWDKVVRLLGFRPPRLSTLTEESFGRLLGEKSCLASGLEATNACYAKADDATKATLTKLLGGYGGVQMLRALQPQAREVIDINHRLLTRKIHRLPLEARGRFYRGYGEGLLSAGKLTSWHKSKGPRLNAKAYKQAFAVMHWQELEARLAQGGWDAVGRYFYNHLPKDAVILPDSFIKTLKMAGLKSPRPVGRPRKSGSKSSVTS